MPVTLSILGGPNFTNVPWTSGMTGRDVLEAAYNELTPPVTNFTYDLQYYGTQDDLGYLVSMINGTFDSFNTAQEPYFFWEFLVDDEVQDTGIDYTLIPDNCTVSFSFVQYIPEQQASKAMVAKYQRRLAYAK